MAVSGKRSPTYFNGKIACDKDGKFVAGEFDAGLDHGPFAELGDDKLTKILRFMFYPYYDAKRSRSGKSSVHKPLIRYCIQRIRCSAGIHMRQKHW